jgi:hypothetical protein
VTERIDAGRGLGRLIVVLLEIIRELLERQAVRRMDAGTLSAADVERLGQSLIDLDLRLAEIREALDEPTTERRPSS